MVRFRIMMLCDKLGIKKQFREKPKNEFMHTFMTNSFKTKQLLF